MPREASVGLCYGIRTAPSETCTPSISLFINGRSLPRTEISGANWCSTDVKSMMRLGLRHLLVSEPSVISPTPVRHGHTTPAWLVVVFAAPVLAYTAMKSAAALPDTV